MSKENIQTISKPTGLLGSEDWWAVWLGLFITLLGLGISYIFYHGVLPPVL